MIVLLAQEEMVYDLEMILPLLVCRQVYGVKLFEVTEEVRRLEPCGFETIMTQYLLNHVHASDVSISVIKGD